MTLACLLLMQCCSMHMVPGSAGHVWFIQWVHSHTHAQGFHTGDLYSLAEEFEESHLFIGWQRRWQTDPQVQGCFCWWQMWRFDSLNLAHMLTEKKHISLSYPDTGRAQSYTLCRGMFEATSGNSIVLLCSTSTYMWSTCGILSKNISWFIATLYLCGRCYWFKH